jgi:hypothetical protein
MSDDRSRKDALPLAVAVEVTGLPHLRLDAALDDMLQESYQRGLADGLEVARRIRGWLTREPDRGWQRQVREWADAEIEKAERKTA